MSNAAQMWLNVFFKKRKRQQQQQKLIVSGDPSLQDERWSRAGDFFLC